MIIDLGNRIKNILKRLKAELLLEDYIEEEEKVLVRVPVE